MITAKPDTWLYPDEEILLEVGLFLSGIQRVQDQLSSQAVTARGNLPSPGIRANVSSVAADKQPTNNVATVLYQIVYSPNIVIGAGEAVPTLVDDRKKARKLKGRLPFAPFFLIPCPCAALLVGDGNKKNSVHFLCVMLLKSLCTQAKS
ncbi:unnamed protein product [Dibothriocephalus latus]|uniref:Uncharacterized protein n=1 Tax=Dibothriocephalus latus TaxID=60516 RepID=A0A3P7P4Q1_DIBLA|nr:unnamed protein product [Dibothriocephalus latus]